MTDASDVSLKTISGNIAVLSSSMFTVIDPSKDKVIYTFSHGYSNPLINVYGGFAVIYDQGGFKFRLDNSSENIYEQNTENSILTACVSNNGEVAVATTSEENKNTIFVYSKSLSEKLIYNVNDGYISNIALSADGKNLAYVTVTSENGVFTSTVNILTINGEKVKGSFSYSSSVVDLHFTGSNLYVVGKNFVSLIKSLDTEINIYNEGEINVSAFCYNPKNQLIVVFPEYVLNDHNIVYINKNGKIKQKISTELQIKDISASSSYISILTDGKTYTYNASNGTVYKSASLNESYSLILRISSQLYGLHQSEIEVIEEN